MLRWHVNNDKRWMAFLAQASVLDYRLDDPRSRMPGCAPYSWVPPICWTDCRRASTRHVESRNRPEQEKDNRLRIIRARGRALTRRVANR